MSHYTVTYELDGPDIAKAAWNLAIGQSIGNPNIRNEIETSANIKEMEALIDSIEGNIVKIKFPLKAFAWPNLNQLMCIIQGGQSDIADVTRCRVGYRRPSVYEQPSSWNGCIQEKSWRREPSIVWRHH